MTTRIVVVGGSIAAATAASTLRLHGFAGDVVMLSAERTPPYSRVPLSKGVLAGTESVASAALPSLPSDVEVRLGARAVALESTERTVRLTGGTTVPYDAVIIATGARARRLAAAGQHGELVLRDLRDAETLRTAAAAARTAVIVGGGFLGMELASTLVGLGVQVTVVTSGPPLVRQLGPWLAAFVCARAVEHGVRIVSTQWPARLVGDPVDGVDAGAHGILRADLVVSAAGDLPNSEWLRGSGLTVRDGVVADDSCVVRPGIAVAGDVAAGGVDGAGRSPHWTNAVVQGAAAARAVLGDAAAVRPDPYYWTEQFGLDVKISGRSIPMGAPEVLEGDPAAGSALLRWRVGGGGFTAVAINHRMPVLKLKHLGAAAPPEG